MYVGHKRLFFTETTSKKLLQRVSSPKNDDTKRLNYGNIGKGLFIILKTQEKF